MKLTIIFVVFSILSISATEALGESLIDKAINYVKEKFQGLENEIKDATQQLSNQLDKEVTKAKDNIEKIYNDGTAKVTNKACMATIQNQLEKSKTTVLQTFSDCPQITDVISDVLEIMYQGGSLIINITTNLDNLVSDFGSCAGIFPWKIVQCIGNRMKEIPKMFVDDFECMKDYTVDVWDLSLNITESIGQCLHIVSITREVDRIVNEGNSKKC